MKHQKEARVSKSKNINEKEDNRAGRKSSYWFYLFTDGPIYGEGERTDVAPAQILLLPLVAEEL